MFEKRNISCTIICLYYFLCANKRAPCILYYYFPPPTGERTLGWGETDRGNNDNLGAITFINRIKYQTHFYLIFR